jgi:hypothetical protein
MSNYDIANEYMDRGFLYTSDTNLVDYMQLIRDCAAERNRDPMFIARNFAAAVLETGTTIVCRKGKFGSGFRPDEVGALLIAVEARLG